MPAGHNGDSRRWNTQNPPMNMEMTGYIRANGDDTVSAKVRGGRHTDSDPQAGCCYIPQAPTRGGNPEYQVECPHPENHDCPFTRDARCEGTSNWRGYKCVVWNTDRDCVYWELWEDQGNNDSRPANEWVRVSHHTDCSGNCGDIDRPLLRPKKSSSQATWRIDVGNTQMKWASVVEVIPGSTAPGGTTAPPPVSGGGTGIIGLGSGGVGSITGIGTVPGFIGGGQGGIGGGSGGIGGGTGGIGGGTGGPTGGGGSGGVGAVPEGEVAALIQIKYGINVFKPVCGTPT